MITIQKNSQFMGFILITSLLSIPLYPTSKMVASPEKTTVAQTTINEQELACLWQNFFNDVHLPGNGMIFLDDCIDKTCAYLKDKAGYELVCSSLTQLKTEESCQEVAKAICQLTNSYILPSQLHNIFSNLNQKTCECRIKERRAIALLNNFLNTDITDTSLQWSTFVDKIVIYLDGIAEYNDLRANLIKLRSSTNAISIGVCLMSYFDILPKEIREKSDKIGKLGLIKLFNKRIKK